MTDTIEDRAREAWFHSSLDILPNGVVSMLVAFARAEVARSQWSSDMSAAPRDGLFVDLWVHPGPPRRIANCRWSESGKDWLDATGAYIGGRWFYDDDGNGCLSPGDRGPLATIVTHWMRVAPPEMENGE